jgi:anti-sigma factor RsiW
VKSYLLGTLPDDEASAFEERYFVDPAFFNEIRRMEIDLICEFLDEELTEAEQEQFKRRCLQVPRLKKLVEDVRERREANIPPPRSRAWIISVVAALVCISVVVAFVIRRKDMVPPVQKASVETRFQSVSLFLEPGVTMGAGSETRKLVLPSPVQPVSLVAELPGHTVSGDYVAQVFSIGRDGSRNSVFRSGQIRSVPRTGGQQVTVKLSSTDLPPGDYIMELRPAGGKVSETYVFRVTAADQ